MTSERMQRGVKSDFTLFDIIELIQANDSMGVTTIATELDIAKSTVHAHLASLKERGYIVNDEGGYRIGLKFLQHGIHAQNSYDLYPKAKKKVEHLAERTDERAWCQIEENGMCYYLCGAEGEHSVHPPVQIGEGVHLHTIAGGKAILAHLPEERVHEIIDRHGLPVKTENTISDETDLFADLQRIRKRGYAFNKEESLPGLNAVGAPIQDSEGGVRGALSISGPAERLKDEKLHTELPELLLGTTNELEINLTYT